MYILPYLLFLDVYFPNKYQPLDHKGRRIVIDKWCFSKKNLIYS